MVIWLMVIGILLILAGSSLVWISKQDRRCMNPWHYTDTPESIICPECGDFT